MFSHFHKSLVMAMCNWGERLGYWVAELAKNVDIGEILSVSPKCRDQTQGSHKQMLKGTNGAE